MTFINKVVMAVVLGSWAMAATAQQFEVLDRKWYPKNDDLVDTLLREDKPIFTVPNIGEVYYYNYLYGPTRRWRSQYLLCRIQAAWQCRLVLRL